MPKKGRPDISTRTLAVRVLRDLANSGGFSNRALATGLERHPDLPPRDRGLVTTLVYGVLRHRARLDRHIDTHAERPGGIRGEVREILRVATFEILELARPGPIAMAESIKTAAGLRGGQSLKALLTAILASVERDGFALDEQWNQAPALDALEYRWSIPRWLAGRWIKHHGAPRALARARRLAAPPPIDLRVDLSRTSIEEVIPRLKDDHPGIMVEQVEGQPQALRVRGGGDLFYGPLHDAGLISVQGLAAQQPALALELRPGNRVLDACSGMGVKTLHLAELMNRRGQLVAADIDQRALDHIHSLRRRGRLEVDDLNLDVVCADLGEPHAALDHPPFDAVLLDVPCTGLGNLARHPEIRWNRQYEDIGAAAERQRKLLARNLCRVKHGGRLVYAVCSGEPEEGREVVASVSDQARLLSEHTYAPEQDNTEGFYVATLIRT